MGATKEHGFERAFALYRKRSRLLSENVFVAITDDNGDPQLGMVIEVHEGAVDLEFANTFEQDGLEGDDLWVVADGVGDTYEIPATMAVVIDFERLEDLFREAIRVPHDQSKRP